MSAKKRGAGDGSIYKRGDHRWEAKVTLPGGKRKSVYGESRQEAAEKARALLAELDKGLPVRSDERQTLADFLEGWLLGMQPPRLEPKTHRRYGELLRLHVIPLLGSTRLSKVTAQDVQRLYAVKQGELSSSTVRRIHSVLREALGAAMRLDLVARNVCELVDPPRDNRREMQPLTKQQALDLLAFVGGSRQEAIYTVALHTGMRLGELLGLHWADIHLDDPEGPWLQVVQIAQWQRGKGVVMKKPKTARSRRRIALTPTCAQALRAQHARLAAERLRLGEAWSEQDLVFPNTIGGPQQGEQFNRRIHNVLLARAGLPAVRVHDLRHTAATLLLGARVNPKIVSEMLGHTSVAITLDLYSHVLPDMQQDAAAVMERLLGSPLRAQNGAQNGFAEGAPGGLTDPFSPRSSSESSSNGDVREEA